MLVVRASDGAAFSIYRADLENITTLDELRTHLLSPLLQIPPDCLICMNEEGAQLREDSVQHLAMLAGSPEGSASFGTPAAAAARASPPGSFLRRSSRSPPGLEVERERRLYVFDREHLDADPELVAQTLDITDDQLLTEPALHPNDPLASHIALSHHNLSSVLALLHSLGFQRASLQLALSNLNRVMTGTSTSLSVFHEAAAPNFVKWEDLLEGWEGAMGAIGKVAVVGGLITRAAGHTREGSAGSGMGKEKEKERVLGDYVSRDKMVAVRDGCAKVLDDLKVRADHLQATLENALAGTATVQSEFDASSRDLEDLEMCANDAHEAHMRIEELVRTGESLMDLSLRADCFEELSHIDGDQRDRIRFLVERKNAMTRYLVVSMQRISNLQSDIADMPSDLGGLDHDMRTKTDNFKHLARLEGLIPAYIATVVEVVRRREFARLLSRHSLAVSQSLSHLSTTEHSRRTAYRTSFSGKLPWEVRGLGAGTDDAVPAVDFGVRNGAEELPELGRETLEGLQKALAQLVESLVEGADGVPLQKAQAMLAELVTGLDSQEKEFEAIALGQSETGPVTDSGAPTVAELEKQVRAMEETKEELERQLQEERSGREEELAQLNQLNGELHAARTSDEEVLLELRDQIVGLKRGYSHVELERNKREKERIEWDEERRAARAAFVEVERRAKATEDDLRESRGRTDDLDRQLGSARAGSDELNRQLDEVESRHTNLRSDHANLQRDLERAQTTIEALESRVRAAEVDQRALTTAVADKDRLLRDQRGEAELDRAALEKEVDDLRAALEAKEEEIRIGAARGLTLEEIAEGLREQIARWENVAATKDSELGSAKGEVELARREREEGIVGIQRELVLATRTARAALKIAGDLRDENNKITAVLSTPPPSKSDSSTDNVDKAASANAASTSPRDLSPTSPPLDYAQGDLEELLAEVQKYDRDTLTEAVKAKVESLTSVVKRWSKEAKTYRERAHRAAAGASDKIAFRNFTKGDLALFLPTRNSTVPVWAAFNVSFPHHFLAATGIISEQMKSREWIVARITSLAEKVADAKDPSSNPYLLAPGTKFFLLEVEPWSSKDPSSRSRKHSSTDKVKSSERRASTSGHLRNSRSEASTLPIHLTSSTVLVDAPPIATSPESRRTLPPNATDLARSEYAIIEEEPTSRPPSPMTLLQPVPRSNEPFSTPPSSPSALALALARSPTQVRPDPFANGPFSTAVGPSPEQVIVAPPATDFEPTITAAGAAPAFLPSKKSNSSTSGSTTSKPRFIGASPQAAPRGLGSELAASPASTAGSFVTFPRSASSGSSILSSSIHRRSGSAFASGSPPVGSPKAVATQEAQASGSRWNSLTEDLANATKEEVARERKSTMTVGRNTKGWPGVGERAESGSRARNVSTTSVLDAVSGRKQGKVKEGETASWGASEILKRLKPGTSGS